MSETTVTGPGGEVVVRSAAQQVVAQVRSEDFMQQVAMALPGDVPPERFVRATVTALLANPEIANADRGSLFTALLKSAQDGLLPDGREAALVTFNNKKKGIVEAQYLPMIGGYRKIAGEQGWTIRTQVVYANDEFTVEMGMEPNIVHRPVSPGVERGPAIAAYAVGAHGDGRREVEVMTAVDIAKIKATSRAAAFGPWKDWEDRMWEKTVGRRLFKKLPLGDAERVARVVAASASQLEPAEAVAALYGPEARTAISGPVEGEVINGVYHEEETEFAGSEADAANALGATDDHPPVERAASETEVGGAGDEGVVSDSERLTASADSEPPPTELLAGVSLTNAEADGLLDVVDEEPLIPMPEVERPAVDPRVLAQARKAKPPMGSYQDKSLDWIVKTPAANEWLVYALKKWPSDSAFGQLLHAIVQAERPELLKEGM